MDDSFKFKSMLTNLRRWQNGQNRTEDEDETVDVESYGDEAFNCAVNLASQQNNNNNNSITKLDPVILQSSPRSLPSNDDHIIKSGSNLWQHNKHRLGASPGSINAMLAPMNCTTNHLGTTNVSRATPTSSDQISEYEHPDKDGATIRGSTQMARNNCETAHGHDEDVIVDNADDDDCGKKVAPRLELKREDKNR